MREEQPPNVLTGAAPRLARPGYDHDWFDWRPLPERSPVSWPDGRSTAVSVVINLAAVEWEDADAGWRPRPPGGRGLGGPPDVPRMSHREFGHRVGIFRLLDIAEAAGIRPAIAVDVMTAECYPTLLAHVLPAAAEILCGGLSASRPLTSAMTRGEETDYINQAMRRLTSAIGERPVGWLSPSRSESRRTPALLADAEVGYVAEWANDDVPYPFRGIAEGLWAYPLSWELSDLAAVYDRAVAPDVWATSAITAFDTVHGEGGRVFNLNLDPWLSGQAFRASALERVLRHVTTVENIWMAPPKDVVAHCEQAYLT